MRDQTAKPFDLLMNVLIGLKEGGKGREPEKELHVYTERPRGDDDNMVFSQKAFQISYISPTLC